MRSQRTAKWGIAIATAALTIAMMEIASGPTGAIVGVLFLIGKGLRDRIVRKW